MTEVFLLLLLLVANGSPLFASMILRKRWNLPLDGGTLLADGQPLFGRSKTLRGLVAALLVTGLVAPLLGFPWWIGSLIGLSAMLGDLSSSFIKRRLGLQPGARATGLDQIPESLFPLLVCQPILKLPWTDLLWLPLVFMIAVLAISRLSFWMGIRVHPH